MFQTYKITILFEIIQLNESFNYYNTVIYYFDSM